MKLNLIKRTDGIDAIYVNPSRIIVAYIDEDGDPCVQLDGFYSIWGQYTQEAYTRELKYVIDMESYKRVVSYLEAIDRRQLGRDD